MTLLDLITMALKKANEDTDAETIHAEKDVLTQYINEAYREISRFRERLFMSEVLSSEDGFLSYSLFSKKPMFVICAKTPSGGAVSFRHEALGIRLAGENGAQVEYYYMPDPLTEDGDVPEIPEYAHTALSDYAAYRFLSGEGSESREKAQEYLRAYIFSVSRMGTQSQYVSNKY